MVSKITFDGLGALSSAIQELPNLSSLALNFSGNKEINTLQNIPSLYSVDFSFGRCLQLNGSEKNGFQCILTALKEAHHIRKVVLSIPFSNQNLAELSNLKEIKNVQFLWV